MQEILTVVSYFVGVALGVLFHELGHALMAYLGSVPVRVICVGQGPCLFETNIGQARFELRALPLVGFVATSARFRNKLWLFLYYIGGFVGNIALVVLVAMLDGVGAIPKFVHEFIGPAVLAQLFLIVVNVFPFRFMLNGRRVGSDGWHL